MNIGLGLQTFAVPGLSGEASAQAPSQRAGLGAQTSTANNSGGGDFFATLANQSPAAGAGLRTGVQNPVSTSMAPIIPGGNARLPGLTPVPKMTELVEAFLEEMQEKFLVTGQEVVQALGIAQSPQMASGSLPAAQKFTDALGLQGADAESAMAMYRELMAELKIAQVNSGEGPEKLVQLEVMSAEDFQKQKLHQSIDRMNQDFFQAPAAKSAKSTGALREGGLEKPSDSLMKSAAPHSATQAFFSAGAGSEVQIPQHHQQEQQSSSISVNRNAVDIPVSDMRTSRLESLLAEPPPLRLENGAMNQASLSTFNKKKGLSAYGTSSGINPLTAAIPTATETALDDFSTDLGSDSAEGAFANWSENPELTSLDETSLSAFETSLNPEAAPEAFSELGHALTGPGAATNSTGAVGSVAMTQEAEFLPQPPTVSAEDQDANIRELIQKAEVLLKDGGGEMKIDLKPDGLGQVRLRVAVNDGRVQIQMISENRQVRSLLEDGALDLKNQLMAQSLKVDQIAIDRVDRPADTQLNQSNDFGQSHQQREMARDFMESFREERQAFREGFAGIPSLGRRTQEREEIQPLTPSARRGTTERRLDLVA